MKNVNKILTISLLTSSVLLGATPNIGDVNRQIQAPKDLPKKVTPLVDIDGVKKYKEPMSDDKSGKTIFVKDFKIENAIHISETELKNLISSFINKDLTFSQLQEVASIITKEYRKQGYFVARAYLPIQNIQENDNVIIISIIEGNYGEFKLKNTSLVKDSVVQNMLDEAKKDNVIATSTLERSMLLINDTPGVMVSKAELMPGAEVGSSDFDIETTPQNRVDGYVVADNYGSKYTGRNRVQALVNVNSPFNIGDKLTVSGLVSNGADLKNGKIAYSAPLASNGLRGEMSYSRTDYSLTKDYKYLNADGDSEIFDLGVSYPVIRTQSENLNLSLKFANKDMNDYQDSDKTADKNIKSFVASVAYLKDYSLLGLASRFDSNFNLTTGRLNSDNSNVDTGRYNKIDFYVSNLLYLNQTFSLNTNLTAQKVLGNKNLDGSEDLSLGGAYGVKLYPDSEQSAENGYIFNTELFAQLPNINQYAHKVGLFYDVGNVYMEDSSQDANFDRATLQDVGIGYYSNYKDFFLKTQMAWNLNSQAISSETTSHGNTKLLIQAGMVF
ncbi:MAG: ShlB/FhaC/HecB family hemolysin secretion/activation protein [Arcobacter sp.]|jgi:hemolysin activation/secretion protein|uniref:ShlB/FhaC/HecB family hemolysin secretion/activation protein n=1 Tax=Arcobacter sp. TaxID=1872629 RepID=UPI002A752ADF|nr:ShlB/FhaC/HecB family hemolysin secretion/activation protein [Arcobacter sp.]MDY3199905.1 ShlB/FhaC/HecB family hemolysin secretion/activation protein [Arcobacter sp.]